MRLLTLSFLALFFNQSLACPDCLQQVENLQRPPRSWSQSRPVSQDHIFQLSIALNRGSHIGDVLYKISTPGHPQYGKHLSQSEAQHLLKPDKESHQQILSWLAQNDIPTSDINDESHWVRFNTTVEKANRMLAARFTWYRNADNGMEVLRTLRYSVPQVLSKKISLVSPTTRFCDMKGMHSPLEHHELKRRNTMPITQELPARRIESRATVDPSCNRTITPTCLRALYNVPANITMSPARGVGVYASQNQVAKFTDFNLFIKNVAPESTGSNFSFVSINGGTTDQNTADSDDETNFDVEYSAALSFPIPNVIFSIGGQGPIQPELGNAPGDGTEPWLQWLDAILAMPNEMLPHTITTSFGENEQALPDGYVQQVCNQFGALGARGVSFIAASGDSGPGSTCTDNTGNATKFQAIFPGSCPFVTATGGTKGVNPEVAVPFASGGFSEKFARPAYQDQAVPAYLNTLGTQFNGLFNAAGRGFPDVSAQSFNISFVDNALKKGFAGTSAASPIWAGLIGQVNAALIAQNKAPLGFLNPWLYSAGMAGLTDVVLGGSIGCTGSNIFTGQQFSPALGPKIVPNAGWNATAGWDPVTGLGTPNIEKLLSIAMGNATAAPARV